MFTRILPIAGIALALLQAPAGAAETQSDAGMDTAIAACTAINQYAPVNTVASVADGLGDWVVWIKDKDDDLWLCNANASGAVFANVMMEGDLLSGDGQALIGFQAINNRRSDPSEVAQTLCSTVGSYVENMQVVATADDGLGDYVVWLKNDNEALWLCNASSDGKLYDFEPVGMPMNNPPSADIRLA